MQSTGKRDFCILWMEKETFAEAKWQEEERKNK